MLYLIALGFGFVAGTVLATAGMARRVIRGRVEICGRVYTCADSGPTKR